MSLATFDARVRERCRSWRGAACRKPSADARVFGSGRMRPGPNLRGRSAGQDGASAFRGCRSADHGHDRPLIDGICGTIGLGCRTVSRARKLVVSRSTGRSRASARLRARSQLSDVSACARENSVAVAVAVGIDSPAQSVESQAPNLSGREREFFNGPAADAGARRRVNARPLERLVGAASIRRLRAWRRAGVSSGQVAL